MRHLLFLVLCAGATRISRHGVVENIASTSRKHIGRRRVDLDVTGARLVVVTRAEGISPNAERYRGAVVLIEQRPSWCSLGDYHSLVRAGALAVIQETLLTAGLLYSVRQDQFAQMRGNPLPWLDMKSKDSGLLKRAFAENATITLLATPNPWLAAYQTSGFLVHRVAVVFAGFVPGLLAAVSFQEHRFSIVQALRQPTMVSTTLMIEALVCPALGIVSCFCGSFLYITDAFPFSVQLFSMTLFTGWGLFTTALTAMHWREVRREIKNQAARRDHWVANRARIWILFGLTVGVDTVVSLALATANADMHDVAFELWVTLMLAVAALAQAAFAVHFIIAAFRMRKDVLLSLRLKLATESPVRQHVTSMISWLALSGLFMICYIVPSGILSLKMTRTGPDQVVALVTAGCYFRIFTSFAQVMSLRTVPNTPVLNETLVGGRPPSWSFREGRLLPRWLLLNREVDRIAVQQDGDEEAAKIQREGAYSVPETIPASGSLVPAVDEDKSADEEERRSHSVDGSSDTGRSRSGTGSRTHEHVPPLPKNRHRRWPRRSPPPKPTVAGSLDSSVRPDERELTAADVIQMFPGSPLAELCIARGQLADDGTTASL